MTTPGEGDIILCLASTEGRHLAQLYPAATIHPCSPRTARGRRIQGRIYATEQAMLHRDGVATADVLRYSALKAGADTTVHPLPHEADEDRADSEAVARTLTALAEGTETRTPHIRRTP